MELINLIVLLNFGYILIDENDYQPEGKQRENVRLVLIVIF